MSKASRLGAGSSFGQTQSISARRAAINQVAAAPTEGAPPPVELPVGVISLNPDNPRSDLGDLTGRPSIRRPELLDRLELSARTLRRPVRDYSRGMRQKIGIIQALQHDPELAILDEPTEGLDPLMQRAFYGILDDLRAAGRTIFFSSHVLSEVERVCDRVAIVDHGNFVR